MDQSITDPPEHIWGYWELAQITICHFILFWTGNTQIFGFTSPRRVPYDRVVI
jgi:hypothetical protein